MRLVHIRRACVLGLIVLTGCATFGKRETTTLRFHEQVTGALPDSRLRTVELPSVDLQLAVNPYPVLSERDVQAVELVETAGGTALLIRFDAHGMFALDEVTTRNRGRYLVVFLNERPVAAWLVTQRIVNGQFLLEGEFDDEEARKVAAELNKKKRP